MKVTYDHQDIEAVILAHAAHIGLKVNTCILDGGYGSAHAELTWEASEAEPTPIQPPPAVKYDDTDLPF
jgi:hypothetical protein